MLSRDLLLALSEHIDVVFFPGPASIHVRSIVSSWRLGSVDENDRSEKNPLLVQRYLLASSDGDGGGIEKPTVEAFPDRDREIRGVLRAVVDSLESGLAARGILVAAPRVDRYTEAIEAACSEFGVPYYVGGLRFFATLPIDRLAQSLLRYFTASPSEEGRVLGEVLTRSGWGFAPFRISALLDRLGTKPQGPTEWLNGAKDAGWPERDTERLETVLEALAGERREWQIPRPGAEWAGRFTRLLSDLDVVAVLGRDLIRRARKEHEAELPWEGQGTRRYLDRIGAFAQALTAGEQTASLGWGRMSPEDFGRLYTGDVSFGSYLPAYQDINAIRFLDIEDVLLQEVEHLWVIDFGEGSLPLDYARPSLIPERVREYLARQSGILTRDRHLLLQRGNFEKVFPVPRRSIRFTYPYQDERAHTRLPSPFALTYGLVTGAEVENVISCRRQAHEFFPRLPAERPTVREAIGLAAWTLHSPAPAAEDTEGAAKAGVVRNIRRTLASLVEPVLKRGALFLYPPAVVDASRASSWPEVPPESIAADRLVDEARCPFRVYARSVLHLLPPRRERWSEDPLWAVDRVLAELLTPGTWDQLLGIAHLQRWRLFREAAQRVVAGDETVTTRGFQEYVARQAFDYVTRTFFTRPANGGVRRPLDDGGKVRAKFGRVTVEGLLSRVDDVDQRRVAILHIASPVAVERMWSGAFGAEAPAKGGDPRPAVVALGVEKVQSVEMRSLPAGRNAWERLHEVAGIDREREAKPPGEWEPKVRHLGPRFDRMATESVKAALDAFTSLLESRRFEIKPQPDACVDCGFGALCQRRWLPFPQEGGGS